MSRRTLTTYLASVLAAGLALVGGMQAVPYVLLSPGPAFNTLGSVGAQEVLSITGGRTYPTDGALDATTVSVTDRVSLFDALRGWVSSSEAVVPRELVYPPDQSASQTSQQNAVDMSQSQNHAMVAAMSVLGIKGTTQVEVAGVTAKGPSDGQLKAGDLIVSIDGSPVPDVAALRQRIGTRAPGATVVVGYLRGETAGSVTLTTVATQDADRRAVIGIQATTRAHYPIKVDIKLSNVGGPSAGLMFALGIVDKLQPGSLTGGRLVAGTGEIDDQGTVGEIGGIAQKMRGAVAAHATVFLVPDKNCAEAAKTRPRGLQLIRVTTLRDALSSLATLRAGGTPPSC